MLNSLTDAFTILYRTKSFYLLRWSTNVLAGHKSGNKGKAQNTCDLLCLVPNGLELFPLQWRRNERDGVSNQRRLYCLLNRLFRRKSKKTSKLSVTGRCEGKPPVTLDSPHKGSVTRKCFHFKTSSCHWHWDNYSTVPSAS